MHHHHPSFLPFDGDGLLANMGQKKQAPIAETFFELYFFYIHAIERGCRNFCKKKVIIIINIIIVEGVVNHDMKEKFGGKKTFKLTPMFVSIPLPSPPFCLAMASYFGVFAPKNSIHTLGGGDVEVVVVGGGLNKSNWSRQ